MPRSSKKQSRLVALLRKVLGRLLLAVLVLVCVGVFYIAVILAEVPPDMQAPKTTPVPVAALSPEQPRHISSPAEMERLMEIFPAPVLVFQASDELIFDEGLVNDLAYEGAFARRITLAYHTPAGEKLMLHSIYPGEALSLLPAQGYALKDDLTASLAGMTAVRMENGETLRLHVRGESALYAMTAPLMGQEQLSQLSRQALLLMP